MKHEYHLTISRTDRIWLIIFVSALLGWELIKPLLPSAPPTPIEIPISFQSETNSVSEKSSRKRDDGANIFRGNSYSHESAQREEYSNDEVSGPVEIMTATWKQLRAIGFQPKVASNIEKYVAAGGVIENVSQLMKIYGMDSLQWEKVSPYVLFPEEKKNASLRYPKGNESIPAEFSKLDINQVSAEELEALPGIGTVLAERIIKYRNSLGGFINVGQVGECYGMPPETLEKILPKLSITQSPSLISINKVDLKNFNHPYLNRKMIKILEAYRAQHGPLDGASALRKIYPPDTTWCDKLLPYILFE